MAPMACRVPDTKKDRFAVTLGLSQSLFAPSLPPNRVIFVLKKLGTLLPRKFVHGSDSRILARSAQAETANENFQIDDCSHS
jgi:hypothetical protein